MGCDLVTFKWGCAMAEAVSHCRGMGSIPGQPVCNFGIQSGTGTDFCLLVVPFPLSSFHQLHTH